MNNDDKISSITNEISQVSGTDNSLNCTFPGVDVHGNVWMINTMTGKAGKVQHLCEMNVKTREQLVNIMIDAVLKAEQYCEPEHHDK